MTIDGKKRRSEGELDVADVTGQRDALLPKEMKQKKVSDSLPEEAHPANHEVILVKGTGGQVVNLHLHIKCKNDGGPVRPIHIQLDGAVTGNVHAVNESEGGGSIDNVSIFGGAISIGRQIVSGNSTGIVMDGDSITINGTPSSSLGDCSGDGDIHLTINGAVGGGVKTQSGSVTCHAAIEGPIKTMSGAVHSKAGIGGSVNTLSGSVHCQGPIYGKVSTMSGNIFGQRAKQ